MPVHTMSDADFSTALEEHNKVIVKYYADWCGSCKLFAPKFRRLSDDARFEGVAFLDINSETNPEARKRAGVDNLPFFATFLNGELLEAGATAKEETVVAMLERLIA
ncbi:MAG: thioredoxin family protein [bacterium]|nr:thioredoxin family protein [bacterium]